MTAKTTRPNAIDGIDIPINIANSFPLLEKGNVLVVIYNYQFNVGS